MIIQNFSVSSLISEINNIKIEAESLPNYPLSFMNSLMNPFNNNTQLEERIINISIKLMNTGIMCLKSILNYDQYLFKYQSKFQKISEELPKNAISVEKVSQYRCVRQLYLHYNYSCLAYVLAVHENGLAVYRTAIGKRPNNLTLRL